MTPSAPLRVLHLPLDAPTVIECVPGSAGAFAVFWLDDVPLGHIVVLDAELPLPASAVRERALTACAAGVHAYSRRPGEEDAGLVADTAAAPDPLAPIRSVDAGSAEARVSVVVPTRGRPDALARCLTALARLDPLPHEVIVVDNAPVREVEGVTARFPGVRYVHQPEPGLSAARNAGVRTATGDVIAFTDDDVEVHPAWARRLALAFDDPAVAAATGLVLPSELETEAQVAFETWWGFGRGYGPRAFGPAFFETYRARGVPAWELGAGASMVFRRSVLDDIGLFDVRLGAGASGCSEDSELWYRVLAAGYLCRYVPAAVCFHTHRRDDDALHSQLRAYMRGHVAGLLVQHERTGDRGNLRRLFVELPRYYLRRVGQGLLSGFAGREQTVGTEIAGAFSGLLYYARHRRPPEP